jgi:hypothetical protein
MQRDEKSPDAKATGDSEQSKIVRRGGYAPPKNDWPKINFSGQSGGNQGELDNRGRFVC